MQCRSNCRQIGLAMHLYHDALGNSPPRSERLGVGAPGTVVSSAVHRTAADVRRPISRRRLLQRPGESVREPRSGSRSIPALPDSPSAPILEITSCITMRATTATPTSTRLKTSMKCSSAVRPFTDVRVGSREPLRQLPSHDSFVAIHRRHQHDDARCGSGPGARHRRRLARVHVWYGPSSGFTAFLWTPNSRSPDVLTFSGSVCLSVRPESLPVRTRRTLRRRR